MSLKNYEANPLAVFNMRKLDFCPPHFQLMTLPLRTDLRNILNWIYENTEGRFYIEKDASFELTVAFEIHAECTYFALMVSEINKSPELF